MYANHIASSSTFLLCTSYLPFLAGKKLFRAVISMYLRCQMSQSTKRKILFIKLEFNETCLYNLSIIISFCCLYCP